MLLFIRPPEPSGFADAVDDFRTRITTFFRTAGNQLPPVNEGNVARTAKRRRSSRQSKSKTKTSATLDTDVQAKVEFSPKWREYKATFAEAQYGKCGYCEMMVIGGQAGDVEHYWPKGEVWQLKNDPSTWGQERKWASSVDGRKRDVVSDRGYWWRAYDWSNYLLSCTVCNEYWKLSFFPVEENPRTLPPSEDILETPLLLNPFDPLRDPVHHLQFNDLGQVEPKDNSGFGFETIRTCGLDRESLRRARAEKALRAYKLTSDLSKAMDEGEIKTVLKDFFELGKEEYVHSGMVRTIFEQWCGMTWKELYDLVA